MGVRWVVIEERFHEEGARTVVDWGRDRRPFGSGRCPGTAIQHARENLSLGHANHPAATAAADDVAIPPAATANAIDHANAAAATVSTNSEVHAGAEANSQ